MNSIQLPALSFDDVSLMLALAAFVLLIAVEFSSPKYGLNRFALNKRKAYNVAILISVAFSVIVVIRLISLVANL